MGDDLFGDPFDYRVQSGAEPRDARMRRRARQPGGAGPPPHGGGGHRLAGDAAAVS